MANERVPFLAKTAILDAMISAENPSADPEMVATVLDVVTLDKSLRSYFLRNRPNPAWIPILWDNRFFDSPPEPVRTPEGVQFPLWDVQEYLLSVAAEVPDYVLRHLD